MRLTHVSCHRLHRRLSFDLDIAPVTLIVGRNESGKSTALGLPQVGINGPAGAYWPVVGPSPDYDFSVDLLFDDGTTIDRAVHVGNHEARFNEKELAGLRAVQDKIRENIGTAALFKLDELTALSPAKQLAWLEEEVLDGTWDMATVQLRVKEILEGLGVQDLPSFLQIDGFTWPRSKDGRRELSFLREKVSQADHEQDVIARRMKNVVEQDHADAQDGAAPGTVADALARLAAIQAEIEAAKEKRGELQGREVGRREIEAQVANLRIELDEVRARDIPKEIATVYAAIQAREPRLAAAQEEVKNAIAAHTEIEAKLPPLEATLADLREKGSEKSGQVSTTEAMAKELGDLRDFIVGVSELFQALELFRDRLSEHNGDRDLFDRVRDRAHALAHPLDARNLTEAKAALAALRKDYAGCDAQVKALRRQIAAAKTEIDTRRAHAESVNAGQNADIATHRRLKEEAEQRAARLSTLSTRLQELGDSLAGIGDTGTAAVDAQIGALAAEKETLEASTNKLQDQVNEQAARMENRLRFHDAQDRRTSIRRLQKEIDHLWRELLDRLIAPLAEPVNTICRRVIDADWLGTSESGFTWGLTREQVDLGPGSKSGNAVALVALRLAIVSRLKGWRHVILDDLENLQRPRRQALLECMLEQVSAGRLDNFIGAGMFDDVSWVPQGVKIIELAGGAET